MPTAMSADINPPTSPSATHRRASLKVLSRNIDKVTLGNLIFPTWYYSPYPDNIIHEQDANTITVKLESGNHHHHHNNNAITARHDLHHDTKHTHGTNGNNTNGVVKHGSTNSNHHDHHISIPNERAVLDTLHVCPYCFRYTCSSTDFAGHLAIHMKAESDYYHTPSNTLPKRRTRNQHHHRSGSTASDDDDGKNKAPRPVPDSAVKVYSYGGYTVWDIDGEVEKLYCQNLSLFGKLFLEQKSVFFDTAGFHYFVLTYCPPSLSSSTTTISGDTLHDARRRSGGGGNRSGQNSSGSSRSQTSPQSMRKRRRSNLTTEPSLAAAPQPPKTTNATVDVSFGENDQLHHTLDQSSFPLRHQVLGFFSKENLSWDSNNLACILVFPPYQHRNLGQLLMAVSYKLSGWEWEDSIIGGPEKPLSSMGRRSYLRFWSERIARFIMGQSQDAEGLKVFEEGIMEDSEDGTHQVMTGKKRKRKHGKGLLRDEFTVKQLGDRTGMLGEDVVAALIEMGVCDVLITPNRRKKQVSSSLSSAADTTTTTTSTTDKIQDPSAMIINRSKILEWAKNNGVDLVSPVKEEGFLGEWALSEEDDEEEEELDDQGQGSEQDEDIESA